MMRHATQHANSSNAGGYAPAGLAMQMRHGQQTFHHPRTSLGATGHLIHLATVAAPLVIAEVIKDADKRWRAMRMVSVGAAIASEAAWTYRLAKERQRDEEARAALKECSEHCR
jgi:hypothetical protein